MLAWVLSVCSIAVLTAVIGVIAPQGKTGGIVKCAFALICTIVVIRPLVNLKNGEINFDAFINDEIVLQDDFLAFTEKEKIERLEEDLCFAIKNAGYEVNFVLIDANFDEISYEIKKVTVNFDKSVINTDKGNININDEIKVFVSKYLGVNKEDVFVYAS